MKDHKKGSNNQAAKGMSILERMARERSQGRHDPGHRGISYFLHGRTPGCRERTASVRDSPLSAEFAVFMPTLACFLAKSAEVDRW